MKLSVYTEKLDKAAKDRYQEKVGLISIIDPFLLGGIAKTHSAPPVVFPPVDASDMVSYLVLQTSFLTAQQYKSHKSLEAYNQFVCGWVKDDRAWSLNGRIVVTGRVSLIHSIQFYHCNNKKWLGNINSIYNVINKWMIE